MADALLSPAVGFAMCAVSGAAIGASVTKVKKDELGEKKIPIMGVAGALVFAGQMINFTIPATGSSGHIGGGILLAGLLGGVPAFLSITVVVIIQCLFFADGGLLALGCNIFNLGVVPCLLIYPLVFRPILKAGTDQKRLCAASVISAVTGAGLGAFCVVLQTLLSGITALPFITFTTFMVPVHLVIGLVEGVVTAAILSFVYKTRPDIIDSAQHGGRLGGVSTGKVVAALAALTIVAGCGLSLFASGNPDGLEWAVGRTAGTEIEAGGGVPGGSIIGGSMFDASMFDGAASVQESTAFLPGYAFASDPENPAGTAVAGLVGAVATFALAGATGLVITLAKKGKKGAADA